MAIQISLEDNLKKINASFGSLRKQLIVKATRQSLNKTLSSVQTLTNKRFRKKRKMKASDIKKDFMKLKKARGSKMDQLQAEMQISGRALTLIRFVTGPKMPREQKGIAVKKRKPLRVRVEPGKSKKRGDVFIAKGNGGKYQVFRRTDNKKRKRQNRQKGPIEVQKTSALARIFERDNFRRPIETFAGRRLLLEFDRAIKFQLSKMK